MAIAGLERGIRSKVYERIVEQLATDSTLVKIFAKRWDVGYDRPGLQIPTAGTEPAIRLTPRMQSQEWYSPGSQAGFLQIQVDFWLKGNEVGRSDARDAMDCWEAVERCLFSPDDAKRKAFKLELTRLGATTGEFLISQPASTLSAGSDGVANVGVIQIQIKRNIN